MLDYGKADINAPTATATQTRGEIYTHDASAARMQTRSGDENSLSRQYDEAKFPARSSESCSFTIEDDVTLPRTESEKKIRRSGSNSSSDHYMNCSLWTQRAAEKSQCTETIRDHAGFRVHPHVSAACNGLWLSNASENHWQPPISSCESIPRNASRSIHPEHQTLIEYDDGNRPRQGACHGLTRGLATMPCPSSVSEYWNPEIETRMLKSSESTPDDHNAKSNKAGGHRNKQLRLKSMDIPKESTYVHGTVPTNSQFESFHLPFEQMPVFDDEEDRSAFMEQQHTPKEGSAKTFQRSESGTLPLLWAESKAGRVAKTLCANTAPASFGWQLPSISSSASEQRRPPRPRVLAGGIHRSRSVLANEKQPVGAEAGWAMRQNAGSR